METVYCKERMRKSTHEARKIRRAGMIPGILYGEKINNFMFEMAEMDINRELLKGGEHSILNVNVDGTDYKTLIKEIQRDPVTHKVMHIDLEDINSDKVVHSEVSLVFVGEERIYRDGAILQKERDSVKVECKASELPKHINIDLSNLRYGQTLRVRDIEIAEEITFMDDPNTVIVAMTGDNTRDVTPDNEAVPPVETKVHNPE